MNYLNNRIKKLSASFKKLFAKYLGMPRKKKIGIITAIFLTLSSLIVFPVLAWFSYQRQLGDLQYVDSPTKLYITAPEGEEIKYLDLSDVQVSKTEATSKYYVFAVTGSNANAYNLQLAYTTNNQFEYFIYPAEKHTGTVPDGTADPCPTYVTHTDSGTGTNLYFTIDKGIVTDSTGATLSADSPNSAYRIKSGTYLTRQSSTLCVGKSSLSDANGFLNKEGSLIKATDSQHDPTYSYSRSNVQDCAEPLYWQATNIKSNMNPTTRDLMDYYILEVNWSKAKAQLQDQFIDNGETDIIYISVESSTS